MDSSDTEQFPTAPATNLAAPLAVELKMDTTHYIECVVFQVEDTLFSIPKNIVQVPGTPFETIFTLPNDGLEGRSKEHPIVLNVSKTSFRGFLQLLYPIKGLVLTEEELLGALDLATMWEFGQIRNQAIEELTDVIRHKAPVEAIPLARRHNVKGWLRKEYCELIRQEEMLKIDKLHASGLDLLTIAKLISAREAVLRHYWQQRSDPRKIRGKDRKWISENVAYTIIDSTFKEELEGMRNDHIPPKPEVTLNPRSDFICGNCGYCSIPAAADEQAESAAQWQ